MALPLDSGPGELLAWRIFQENQVPIPSGLFAFRLKRGILQPLAGKRVFSPRLALDLRAEGPLLRLFVPGSSQRLLTYKETKAARQADLAARLKAEAALQEAEAARQVEQAARHDAETRATRLEAELAELRRKLEGDH